MSKELVNQLDYNVSGGVGICESCIGGKQCKSSFNSSTTKTSEPLELVHSDLCGKMGKKSIGGAEYFLTFIDDKTHYTWVYPLKTKDQVYNRFREWKAEVETRTGKLVKTLRTDKSTPPGSFRHILKPVGSDMNSQSPRLQSRTELLNDSIVRWWR